MDGGLPIPRRQTGRGPRRSAAAGVPRESLAVVLPLPPGTLPLFMPRPESLMPSYYETLDGVQPHASPPFR